MSSATDSEKVVMLERSLQELKSSNKGKVMNYILPEEARRYVLFQRTSLLPKRRFLDRIEKLLKLMKVYNRGYEKFVERYAKTEAERIDKEYFYQINTLVKTIIPHIPRETRSILDIGCGIAGLDLFLYNNLDDPKLILLDKTEMEDVVWYSFRNKGAYYNSLNLSKEMLELNGVPSSKIKLLQASDAGDICLKSNSVDLIVSTLSWGFHYPVGVYIDSAANILKNSGTLIIDVRKNTNGRAELGRLFDIEIIDEAPTWLTLKGKLKST